MFKKYQHVEKFGNAEVEGIEIGECYVFPKLDGTNASLWWHGKLQAGSRKRQLKLGKDMDNAGFKSWAVKQENYIAFLKEYDNLRLYGEWLVPHTLKTYRDDAWKNFYIFDVENMFSGATLPYEEYTLLLDKFELEYVPPLAIIKNATYENLLHELQNNTYLIQDGKGVGEGIVIKNYDYVNKYGRVTWAKIVATDFKDKHRKAQPPTKEMKEMVEQEIVNKFLKKDIVDKVYSNIVVKNDGWSSKYIPQLLETVYHDFVTEEIWAAIKKLRSPTINFKTLHHIALLQIKKMLPGIF